MDFSRKGILWFVAILVTPLWAGDAYQRILRSGLQGVEAALAEPSVTLKTLETHANWAHFPHAVLAAAMLPEHRALALRIGNLLADEEEAGHFRNRLDHHRDTYMWLEAYRVLGANQPRWRKCLETQISALVEDVRKNEPAARYTSPYLTTSANHFALWAATVLVGGKTFHRKDWVELGSRVLRRFARVEQSADGFWGEQKREWPTPGYDYLTFTAVALYAEHVKDPAAVKALQKNTMFHIAFTYGDGTPVELLNDRNRHWFVSYWGHFGFSRWAAGRQYANLLTAKLEEPTMEALGRIAQNLLYWHAGPVEPLPSSYVSKLTIPIGIRKRDDWTVCLSAVTGKAPERSQWFLDRQSHVSLYHDRIGRLIHGGNSKRQLELATFGRVMEQDGTLHMGDDGDEVRFSDTEWIRMTPVSKDSMRLDYAGNLHLQIAVKSGQWLETDSGTRVQLGAEHMELTQLGGWISQQGWRIALPQGAKLRWPVHPYSPYRNGPESDLRFAVAVLQLDGSGQLLVTTDSN